MVFSVASLLLCSVFRAQKFYYNTFMPFGFLFERLFFMIRHLSFAVLYFLELIGKICLLKYKTNSPSFISANKNFVNPKCK